MTQQIVQSLKMLHPARLVPFSKKLLKGELPAETYERISTAMAIAVPTAMIAPLRYLVADETQDVKERMFWRDASAMVIGAGLFFGSMAVANKALKGVIKNSPGRVFMATLIGWLTNSFFQGYGAVKVSERIAPAPKDEAPVAGSRAALNPAGRLATPEHGKVYVPSYLSGYRPGL